MILYSKPVIESKKGDLKDFFSDYGDSYVAILFFGDDLGSEIYVKNKTRFGEEIGCKLITFGQEKEYSYDDIIGLLNTLNTDTMCIGILIQLPLPDYLKEYQQEFCDLIEYKKDIDCMSSTMIGKICCGYDDGVLPAAVGATVSMLEFYDLHNLKGKQVCILGQSNLVGKPMALYCASQGAQIFCFNEFTELESLKEMCRKSDYIISATGVVGLVDKSFIDSNANIGEQKLTEANKQIVIDIGYGFNEQGKAAGDVKFDEVKDLVHAITPVPGGVGPMCICQLFENVRKLKSYRVIKF